MRSVAEKFEREAKFPDLSDQKKKNEIVIPLALGRYESICSQLHATGLFR